MAYTLRRMVVIGDIHAEDARLEQVLDAIRSWSVDTVVCTGDVVDGRGDPERCCALLQQHHVDCVRGNHDRWVFSGLLRDSPGATALGSLTETARAFLSGLPPTREFALAEGRMLLCHGIGTSDLEKVMPYDTEYSLSTNSGILNIAASYRLMVNGHSHQRMVRRIGGLTMVNAGTIADRDDAGVVLLDFARNVVQWHAIGDAGLTCAEEGPLFVPPEEPRAIR